MKLLDYQYIYLMRKQRSRQHKIGISTIPRKRWQTVNRAVKGEVSLLVYRKVFFARSVEKYLHLTFKASRFILGNTGKGAGNTEWFHFSFIERWFARLWIEIFWMAPAILMAAGIVILAFLNGNWENVDWAWWDDFSLK